MFNMDNLYEIVGNVPLFNVFVVVLLSFLFITFILTIVALWVIFTKANKINWSILFPVWNLWVWFEVCGISGYWSLIPGVNIILLFISIFKFPLRYNKKKIYGLGILFLPYLFLMFFAFNKDLNYIKPEFKGKNRKNKKMKNKKQKVEKIELLELDGTTSEVTEILIPEEEKIEILDEE